MAFDLQFVVEEDSLKSVLKALGAAVPAAVPQCPLVVGDVIAYPAQQALAMRVTRRWFRPGDADRPACWYVHVEQTAHPLD